MRKKKQAKRYTKKPYHQKDQNTKKKKTKTRELDKFADVIENKRVKYEILLPKINRSRSVLSSDNKHLDHVKISTMRSLNNKIGPKRREIREFDWDMEYEVKMDHKLTRLRIKVSGPDEQRFYQSLEDKYIDADYLERLLYFFVETTPCTVRSAKLFILKNLLGFTGREIKEFLDLFWSVKYIIDEANRTKKVFDLFFKTFPINL